MPTLSPSPIAPKTPPKTPPRALWKPITRVGPADELLARQAGISPVAAALLRSRGHGDLDAMQAFFHPQPTLLRDPAGLPDIEKAVARLIQAIEKQERILIFGDYDADGVTSTALLIRSLRLLGAQVDWRLPERNEGYGMNNAVIEEAKAAGFDLLMSADCGIRDVEPARRAREIGLDLIISDHHEPSGELPDCIAVVNPKRADSQYGFDGLSGCGVAFKIMQALVTAYKPRLADSFGEKYLDFVALSTIADCVPLLDENRYLASAGLLQLYGTKKKGLRALINAANANVDKKRDKGFFVGRDVSWGLAPRLNAAGRLASPKFALELLLCDDAEEAARRALHLNEINAQRKGDQETALKGAIEHVRRETDLDSDVLLIAAHPAWHRGIVGLIAGKLVEKFHRPAFAFNISDGHAHGSGRSLGDFDLHALLEATSEHYTRGGGHAAACGLSLPAHKIEDFRAAALEHAHKHLTMADLRPILSPDCELRGRHIDLELTRELRLLEPCGTGNQEPKFLLRGAIIESVKGFGGGGAHLEVVLRDDGKRLRAIWWRMGERLAQFGAGDVVELIFVPQPNEFNGSVTLQLIIEDLRLVEASE